VLVAATAAAAATIAIRLRAAEAEAPNLFVSPHTRIDQGTRMNVRDSNGTALAEGDAVTVIKDLKVKGTSVTLKRGTLIKNIRLTEDEEEIECNSDKVKGLVLKTCFLKKA
jgi:protein PhnA